MPDSVFCFVHDPAHAQDRKLARSKGGKARHGRKLGDVADQVTIESVADLLKVLERAINDVLSLENSIARARALGYLVGVGVKALETSELAEQQDRILAILQERKNA